MSQPSNLDVVIHLLELLQAEAARGAAEDVTGRPNGTARRAYHEGRQDAYGVCLAHVRLLLLSADD